MEVKKHKKKTVKPKNRFTICCFCLDSSSSDIDLNVPFGNNETYDYVVEKLAIKKVPITLFATEEDLAEMQNINSLNNTGGYNFSPKDKKSATVFSSYYSKIPKNGKNVECNKNKTAEKLNKKASNHKDKIDMIEIIPEVQTHKSNDTPSIISSEKEIVTADIHNVPSEMKKLVRIAPQLHETLQELGSKQRPSGSPGIKHRTVTRQMNEINIINSLTVQENPLDTKQNYLGEVNKSSEITQEDTLHKKIFKRIFPSLETTDDRRSSERTVQKSSITSEQQIDNNCQINTFLNNIANKVGTSQKWKIIIKEHEEEEEDKDNMSARQSTDSSSEYSIEADTVSETE